jgi:hypothetical protein
MIDADKLINWLCNGGGQRFYAELIEKINELATTPEPQESIFDADGWSKDFSIMPKDTWVQITFNNCVKAIAKFDKNLNIICTDWCDVDKIKTINKWRPLPTLPTGDNE